MVFIASVNGQVIITKNTKNNATVQMIYVYLFSGHGIAYIINHTNKCNLISIKLHCDGDVRLPPLYKVVVK